MGTYDLTLTSPTFVASTMGQAISNCYGSTSASPTPTSGFWGMVCRFNILNITAGPKMLGGQTKVGWWAMNANGTIQCNYGFTAEATVITPAGTRYDDGVDHEAKVVFNASGATILIDGVVKANNVKTFDAAGPGTPVGAFFVGNFTGDAGYTWPGTIDQFAVYSGTLSSAAYTPSASPIPTNDTGLVALWNFNGNGLDTAGATAPAATAITLSGPTSGLVSTASTNFTIGANGTLSSTITVTPSDGGAGGTFTPTSVQISSATATATFTYAPSATAGAKSITVTNNGGLSNPAAWTYTATSGAATVSSVTVAPSAPTVNGGATQQFTATVNGTNSPSQAVTWAVTSGVGAVNSSSGLYTAPAATGSAQSATITATSTADNTKSGSATVTIPAAAGNNALVTANIKFSPGNWDLGTNTAKTISPGAYYEMIVPGDSLTFQYDMTNMGALVPELEVTIDGVVTVQSLAASMPQTMPTNTADWGAHGGHVVRVVVKSRTETQNIWGTPLSLTGIIIDAGKSLIKPASRALKGMVMGDSIPGGYWCLKPHGTPDIASHHAALTWAFAYRDLLGAEIGIAAYSATGWNTAGVANVPSFANTYDKLYAGVNRVWPQDLDFIEIALGTNDGTTDLSAMQITIVNAILAATPAKTKIFLTCAFNGWQAATLPNVVAGCSTPSRVIFINATGMFRTANSNDSVHPYGNEHMTWIAPQKVAIIKPIISGSTATGTGSGTFQTDAMLSSGTLRTNQACQWTWFSGGVIGSVIGTPTYGSGTTSSAAKLTATGLPSGPGYILVRFADGGRFYQEGTVA